MKKLFKIVLILLVSAAVLFPQSEKTVSKRGTSAAQFLSIGQGAKAMGMGGAFVALANDASAIYWNPAGIAEQNGGGFLFDHTEWIADLKYNYMAGYYNVDGLGTFGFSFTSSDIGSMKVTTIDDPEGTGEVFSVSDVAFSVTYALQLTNRFSIGFNPKYIRQTIWRMSASAFAFDLGAKYVTPFDNAVLAMSVSNFGTKMQMLGNSNLVLHDLDPGSTGNNDKIPANLETDEWALPLTFRVGLAYQVWSTEFNKLTIAADALHPSDDYESVDLGFEYSYDNMVALRGGYKSLFLKDAEEGLTLGVGIHQNLVNNVGLTFDYTFQQFGRLKNIQKISLGVNF